MADLVNDIVDVVSEAAQECGMDVTRLEPVVADTAIQGMNSVKKDSKKLIAFGAGTLFGATCTVIGGKIVKSVKESRDEIAEVKNEAQRKRLEEKEKELQEKLTKIQAKLYPDANVVADAVAVEVEQPAAPEVEEKVAQ